VRLPRFDTSARIFHWSHAVIFIWLLATGIQLFMTPRSLLGDPLIRRIHLYASLPFVLLPVMIYITGSSLTRRDINELISWTGDDLKWFVELLKNRKTKVTGKFNGGQKASFIAMLLLIAGLSFSGFVVWMKSMFSVNFVELNFLIHDFLATLAILLLAGHIAFALYNSGSLRGIIFGEVDEKWAEEHYPAWFEQEIGTK
jgi:formate dehydrogenase subunit gamma